MCPNGYRFHSGCAGPWKAWNRKIPRRKWVGSEYDNSQGLWRGRGGDEFVLRRATCSLGVLIQTVVYRTRSERGQQTAKDNFRHDRDEMVARNVPPEDMGPQRIHDTFPAANRAKQTTSKHCPKSGRGHGFRAGAFDRGIRGPSMSATRT